MLAAFRLFLRQTWRAWVLALPYQAALGLGVGLLLAPIAQAPLVDSATGAPDGRVMATMGGILFLVCLCLVLAAHFSRADSDVFSPFSHLWSLLWRAAAGFLGFALLTGSPLMASIAGVGGSFGFAMAMGLVSVAAFWLMDSAARVGDPPAPPAPRPERPFVVALALILWSDLRRLYRGVRSLWSRIPSSLAAGTLAMFALSIAALPLSFVLSVIAPWLPLWAAVVIAMAGGSVVPTAAAAALRPDAGTPQGDGQEPGPGTAPRDPSPSPVPANMATPPQKGATAPNQATRPSDPT